MAEMKAILQSLKSPLEGERKRAIQNLVRSQDVRAVAVLQKIASSDESVAIRYLSKKALYYMRKQLGLGDLAEDDGAAEEDSGGARPAIPEDKLRAILEGDDDAPKLRLLQALSRKKVASALPVLLAHPVHKESPEVRSNLVLVVGILGGEDELRYLRGFLDDPDPRVRANTIEAVEFLATPRGYPLFVKALGDTDNRIRANAIKALRAYGKENCLALLTKMIASRKVWMRDSAAFALGFLGGAESLPPLLDALRDPEPSVRDKARRGLERLADKGVRPAAEALAEFEEGPPPGSATIETFLSGRELAPGFFAGDDEDAPGEDPLRADDPKARIRAVEEIIETRDRDRRDALLAAAHAERDTYVRAKMVIGLGRIGAGQPLQPLLPFLQDPEDRVRANAVEALMMADRAGAQPHVVPALEDPNNRVRANAVIALKDYAGVDVLRPLRAMVRHPEPLMRRSAFYAITDIGTAEVAGLIPEIIDDENEVLRGKVQAYVEMCADDGDGWAVALKAQRDGGGGLAGEGFGEFAPAAPGAADDRARAASASGARELLRRFRGLGPDAKRDMIRGAREDVCLENYFFLRELLEEDDFEIKVQAKMALRAFDDDAFAEVAVAGEELAALFKPPEVTEVKYSGIRRPIELGKDLNTRIDVAEQRQYWEGPFPDEFVMLNALRDDTREMLTEVIGTDAIERVLLCYGAPRLEPFRAGKKSLDSNRSANLVSLQQQVNRVPSDTFHGSFMHSQVRPAYLLALALETRLLLFLRGNLQSTLAGAVSVPWAAVDRVEANRVGAGTTVSLEAMGVLVEVPELPGDEARWLYDFAKAKTEGSLDEAMATTKEFRRIDLLLQGGVITREEYERRKAALEKARS